MRHAPVLVVLALVLALVLAAPAAAPAQPAPVPGEALFAVSGRGYGHGVGMSQYGAYGQALEGRTYDQILEHYYPGTELARARGRELRVLLAEGRRALAISSPVPFSAVDATGETFRLPAGPLALRADLALPVEPAPVEAVPPLVLRPGRGGPLSVDGRAYRGKVEVAVQGAFLRAVNLVGLELYLRGVVPGEMPFGWPLEALKAQAVAARSYALASLLQGKPFHLYADVRSQAYGGVAVEKPSTTRAVSETAGQVLLYGGRVATTYYFSTSGGRTASAADVFGFASPYLVSRPDPWDRVSPYHRWGPVLFGARTLGAKLGLRAGLRALDATGLATPSGRLRSLRVVTTAGEEAFPASLLRTALGLRSTWVTVSVLRLDRPRGTLAFGGRLRLEGLARGVAAASLAASADGAEWSPVAALRRDAAG
ncbi:MAG TPA: SpoIID/LytB domain-containing protein, partial [Gaiellaceae bacterium]|nr:SpoIID/LytB domain-containing protein [Gaiellaceae bacterium]